jgi:ATP-binding cassette subfamily B protein
MVVAHPIVSQASKCFTRFISFIIFAFSVALILVTWYAMRMLNEGTIGQEELTQFAGLTGMIAASFMQFPELIAQLQRALGATERVRELLHDTTEPADESTAPLERFQGEIELRDITFAYPTRPDSIVLRDFNLSAKAGQRIALVGPSGSGKTTSVSLLFRFYDPTSGEVLIDGKNVRDLSLTTLRRNLALVPQEVLLFGGTIRENIAYGKPGATEEEIVEAARKAQALDFITKMPKGFDSPVGERGGHLSVGQRQRIGIARAFLKNAPILLLDEPTSALDPSTESAIMGTIFELMRGRTTLIVTHRLTTVHGLDRIVVLKDGRIAEDGSGPELIAKNGVYAALYRDAMAHAG